MVLPQLPISSYCGGSIYLRAFANTEKVQEVNNHNKKMEEDREGEGKILLFAEQLVSLHVKISVKKNPKCENRHLHVKVYLHKLFIFLADEQQG